ncbi:MAG TPA: C-terminal binding protein [Paraburkholderia sp.]|jgi:D-3-phosphoglycerate dehydrogenase|nr:C-terminal binding protein [Paraburkholderia sp.]
MTVASEKNLAPRVVGVIEPGYANYSTERRILDPIGAEVRSLQWNGERATLKKQLEEVDVVLVRDVPLDAEAIGHMKPGSGIVRYGVGVDTVDLKAATSRGVLVANVPHYGAEIEVSDHAMALTLALVRRVVSRHRRVVAGQWNIGQREPVYRIAGSTLGLVGFGRIARAYLARMRAFGVEDVLVHDPYVPEAELAKAGVRSVGLDELFSEAAIISLHAPASADNRHLVNARTLGLMRRDACLINTSRGALVDTAALAHALAADRIFGAALDVLEVEPLAADSPLKTLSNVILTDHAGWYSEASVAALQEGAAKAALEILTTGQPTHWVNRPDN